MSKLPSNAPLIMHCLADADCVIKLLKPGTSRSYPADLATVGRRMSQSIKRTLSICAKEKARLMDAVDLPSPGAEEVIVITLRGLFPSLRQIAVLAVFTASLKVLFLSGISSGLTGSLLDRLNTVPPLIKGSIPSNFSPK